ncbi:MAG: hypothetical protein E7256_03900 [Lachnospiraceae bacterium]|nr:hypothetical protein [Lachnospiraceae bacterium]
MRQLKIVKNAYSFLAVGLVILGAVLLIFPKITVGFICKSIGIVLLICGMIKVLGYFTKDRFELAFQFDLGLGIASMIIGLIMLVQTGHVIEAVSTFLGIFILIDAALKIQTAIEAKRFGLSKWWIILSISLAVTLVGILLIAMPWKTTEFITRLIGINLCLDGFLNLWVVQNTVKIIRRNEV